MFEWDFKPFRKGLAAAIFFFAAAGGSGLGLAQSTALTEDAAQSLGQAIATNANAPKQVCPAITPIIHASPASATVVINDAQAQPDLLEPLCECLSQAQKTLKSTNPEGAAIVAKAVASASPAFQACYAIALAAGAGAGAGNQAAGGAPDGGSGGAPFSPVGFVGPGGFGGGPASPN